MLILLYIIRFSTLSNSFIDTKYLFKNDTFLICDRTDNNKNSNKEENYGNQNHTMMLSYFMITDFKNSVMNFIVCKFNINNLQTSIVRLYVDATQKLFCITFAIFDSFRNVFFIFLKIYFLLLRFVLKINKSLISFTS